MGSLDPDGIDGPAQAGGGAAAFRPVSPHKPASAKTDSAPITAPTLERTLISLIEQGIADPVSPNPAAVIAKRDLADGDSIRSEDVRGYARAIAFFDSPAGAPFRALGASNRVVQLLVDTILESGVPPSAEIRNTWLPAVALHANGVRALEVAAGPGTDPETARHINDVRAMIADSNRSVLRVDRAETDGGVSLRFGPYGPGTKDLPTLELHTGTALGKQKGTLILGNTEGLSTLNYAPGSKTVRIAIGSGKALDIQESANTAVHEIRHAFGATEFEARAGEPKYKNSPKEEILRDIFLLYPDPATLTLSVLSAHPQETAEFVRTSKIPPTLSAQLLGGEESLTRLDFAVRVVDQFKKRTSDPKQLEVLDERQDALRQVLWNGTVDLKESAARREIADYFRHRFQVTPEQSHRLAYALTNRGE